MFVLAGLLLNIAPGPDSLLIMARSASQGWRAGSVAAFGIGAGTMVHIAAAALGLSALLAASATGFMLVKLAGAAYLVYIGASMLLNRGKAAVDVPALAVTHLSYRKIFAQGFLTNVLNPKVGIFFLAFVPQFIAPDAPHKALAFVLLGFIFNFNGMVWCNFLAVFTALASRRIRIHRSVSGWMNRLIGGVFVFVGIKLALEK